MKRSRIIRTAILVTIIIFIVKALQAQQPAQYSLWQFNQHHYHPGYAGLDQSLSATGVFRRQWTGLEGAPLSQNINVHFPVLFMRSAFGFKFENDELGAEQNITASATYAYQMQLGRGNWLSIGLNGGILQKTLDGTQLNPRDIDQVDNLIPMARVSAIAPVFNAGVYFKNERLQLGVSVGNVLESNLPFDYGDAVNVQLVRAFYGTAAYKFELGDWAVEPAILVKSDLIETQTDAALTVYYEERIFGGATFRGYSDNSFDALAIFAGFRVADNIKLAYAYDASISALSSVNTGSHEIMLHYNLNKVIGRPLPARIIYNPRFTY